MGMTRILHWPDWELAEASVPGFATTGLVTSSNCFEQKKIGGTMTEADLLATASAWSSMLESNTRTFQSDEVVSDETDDEIKKGLLSETAHTERPLDKSCGKRGWRGNTQKGHRLGRPQEMAVDRQRKAFIPRSSPHRVCNHLHHTSRYGPARVALYKAPQEAPSPGAVAPQSCLR